MNNTQGHPWEEEKGFSRGANSDAEGEVTARVPGAYHDAQNLRLTPQEGNVGDLTKIGGERQEWAANVPGYQTYICIGSIEAAGHIVAYWCSSNPGQFPPMVVIDGTPMVMSERLPWVWHKPMQIRKASTCDEGMIWGTDDYSVPLVFSVQHIIQEYNAGNQTYLFDFNPDTYAVNLNSVVDRPEFLGLFDAGGGGGLSPGRKAYAMRYVDADGNYTNWGPETPYIDIPVLMGATQSYNNTPGMPSASLQGGAASDVGTATRYGTHLRFRLNNINNFSRVEIRRTEYDLGGGLNAVPEYFICHSINLQPGINEPQDFYDTGNNLEGPLADAEVNIQTIYIKRAKATEYIEHRVVLANVEVESRIVEADFTEVGGNYVVPITKNIGKAGHHDPVSNTYFRGYVSGERYELGVQYYDAASGKFFVQPLPAIEVQAPNRRDEKTGDSLALSDSECYAVNVDHAVTPTFEPLDMSTAVNQSRTADPVNIMVNAANNGGPAYFAPVRPTRPGDGNRFGHDYRVNSNVRFQPTENSTLQGYNPQVFEPSFHALGFALYGITNIPPAVKGLSIVRSAPAKRVIAQGLASYVINTGTETAAPRRARNKVFVTFPDITSGIVTQEDFEDFRNNPQNFNLQCVAPLGFCSQQFGGVTFAKRPRVVLSQVIPGVNYTVVNYDNPSDISEHVSILNDQLSFARVMHDTGQVNPGYWPAGVQPADPNLPGNQVGASAWRNRVPAVGPFHEPGQNMNRLLTIMAVEYKDLNGAVGFELTLAENLYADHPDDVSDFMSDDTAAFHEPFYMVNLVRDGAHIDQQLVKKWIPTGHYQRMKSIIGVSNGGAAQEFPLIDERPDDVYSTTIGQLRYVYVNGRAWVLSSNLGFNIGTVINAINQDGFWLSGDGTQVYGVYDFINGNTVRIGSFGINPPPGQFIEIRYNPNAPIKFFGGDCTISQHLSMPVNANSRLSHCDTFGEDQQAPLAGPPEIFSVLPGIGTEETTYYFAFLNGQTDTFQIDNEGQSLRLSRTISTSPSNFELDLYGYRIKRIVPPSMALPYTAYRYNDNYWVPYGLQNFTGGSYNHISDIQGLFSVDDRDLFLNTDARAAVVSDKNTFPGIIRQWAILFDCECRTPAHLSVFIQDSQYVGFPHTHYVQRPYAQETANSLATNGVFSDYEGAGAYGGNEKGRWNAGGFKWLRSPNYDYAKQPAESSFSAPLYGFDENTNLCNSLFWSPRITTKILNSPGYRTFPSTNEYVIQTDTGGINMLQALGSGNGHNLYAYTQNGICELLIGKSTLTGGDGALLGFTRQDAFISQENWKTKGEGCPDSFWRMAVRAHTFIDQNSEAEVVLFPSYGSWNMQVGGTVIDIADGRYETQLFPILYNDAYPSDGPNPIRMAAVFNRDDNEYWVYFANSGPRPAKVCVYNTKAQAWTGQFSYRFDSFVHTKGKMRGFRQASTWRLDENPNDNINGEPIESWVIRGSAPVPGNKVESMRLRINSERKPDAVEILDRNMNVLTTMDAATFGSRYLKDHNGWENWIPRNTTTRDRIQMKLMYFKAFWRQRGADRVNSSSIQFKVLK